MERELTDELKSILNFIEPMRFAKDSDKDFTMNPEDKPVETGEYKGWFIGEAFDGYWFQHRLYESENPTDLREGHADTILEAQEQIDAICEFGEGKSAEKLAKAIVDALTASL